MAFFMYDRFGKAFRQGEATEFVHSFDMKYSSACSNLVAA